jgi:hypothetical protein
MERRRASWVFSWALAIACGGHVTDQGGSGGDASDDSAGYGGGFPAVDASAAIEDTTTTGMANVADADSTGEVAPAPPFDAGPGGTCDRPLAPGDLFIDELMIESIAGTGDHGEWLEIASTLECAIDLAGLHGECPRGAKVATFDVTGDLWVPARGTFVVADSSDPAINHDLPGTIIAWSGNLGDVLRNKGTTVTLRANDVVIDTLTYPALALTVGSSLEFPSDCDATMRSDWSLWSTARASWFPGFRGTPNAPNVDVPCPASGDP